MALSWLHAFVSGKADGTDVTLVKPTNWNAQHVVTTDSSVPVILGATGPGPIHDLPISTIMPTGVMVPYAGATAPAGWYLCDGSPKNRISDAALFAVCGTTYGAGDGSTTFNLPDARGTTPVGKSNMGGSDRGNLPGGATLGAYLGVPSTSTSVAVGSWFGGGSFGAGGYTTGAQSVNFNGFTDGPADGGTSVTGGGGGAANAFHQHAYHVSVNTGGENLGVVINSFGASGGTGTIPVVQPSLVANMIIKA